MKRLFTLLTSLMLLIVCNENTASNNTDNENANETNSFSDDFKSPLRPKEKIELGKIYTDTVEFVGAEIFQN